MRPLGGGRWRHYLRDPLGVCRAAQKTATYFLGHGSGSTGEMSYMLALVGQLSLHGYDGCMVYWVEEALQRNCRTSLCKTSFSPKWVFRFCRNSGLRFWGLVFWHLWIGRARNPGPLPHHFAVDRFLTLVVGLLMAIWPWRRLVDFLAVVERRLIPARVRSEWARLRGQRLASVWAPACQDSPHVSNAGSGLLA